MLKIIHVLSKLRKNIRQRIQRRKLIHTDFTIFSNNCWGGFVYQKYGLPYLTPTIGLGFTDLDYLKFLENLDYYLNQKLSFIDPMSSPTYDIRRKYSSLEMNYPVALLGDVTIWFTHYHSQEEAKEKWERRKNKINKDRVLVKWSQRYGNDPEMVKRFLALPFPNKIVFVEPSAAVSNEQCIIVPELERLNKQGGDETEYTLRQINLNSLLNNL